MSPNLLNLVMSPHVCTIDILQAKSLQTGDMHAATLSCACDSSNLKALSQLVVDD
jgi:hypothetical protein